MLAQGKKPIKTILNADCTMFRSETDPLNSAINAHSLECCQILAPLIPITNSHIKSALRAKDPDILQFLLKERPMLLTAELVVKTAEDGNADMLRVLLIASAQIEKTQVWKKVQITQIWLACMLKIALSSEAFGPVSWTRNQSRARLGWTKRVENIEWLEKWKQKELEGVAVDNFKDASDGYVEDIVTTLYALMTTPIFNTAHEHKEAILRLLNTAIVRTLNNRFGDEYTDESTAFSIARNVGMSTTFNDLLDPDKIEQWYAAIDKAYAQKNVSI